MTMGVVALHWMVLVESADGELRKTSVRATVPRKHVVKPRCESKPLELPRYGVDRMWKAVLARGSFSRVWYGPCCPL